MSSATYRVRIYCHDSHQQGKCCCPHQPHPFFLEGVFTSIREANDHGGDALADNSREDIEWEVVDQDGEVVC